MAKKISNNDIVQHDRKNVRRAYARLLHMAGAAGINVRLNSGHRSIAEQWRLYRLYKQGKGPVAAFPGKSTHNKKDYRQGLDIDMYAQDGIKPFIRWCRGHNIYFDYTVPGEGWHINARRNYDSLINAMWRRHTRKEH